MKPKKVVAIQWNSTDGLVEFWEKYDDGSVGPVENTLLEADDPHQFLSFKGKVERERLGKIING